MMKLQRIRVEQLRQFHQPFELNDLAPGLNLLAGPNEAGKSTLVQAIRAAFFERHRSASVNDLLPWGEPTAAPAVEIDFEWAGIPYRLAKRFLHRKRCHLQVGSKELDGEEAEQHLAELLGFQFPGRGASKPEHWGIPGLLWIEQGGAQNMSAPLVHAGDHLRQALQRSVTEVASSQGDTVIAQVRSERELLLTTTGKPRGAYAAALGEHDEARQRLAALDQRIAGYREQVDSLGRLQQENAAERDSRPWETLRAQQHAAEKQLATVNALSTQLETDRASLRQAGDTLALLQAQHDSTQAQHQQLQRRSAELQQADRLLQEAQSASERWEGQRTNAERDLLQASNALQQSRDSTRHAELAQRVHEAQARIDVLDDTISRADLAQRQLHAQQAQAGTAALDKDDLARLRSQHARLAELHIRQQAVATRVRYELAPQAPVTLAGKAIEGSGECLLTAASELAIGEWGRLQIIPGGADLAALAREASALRVEHEALLQRLGVARLADAESRFATWQQAQHDIELATRAVANLAPRGLETLRQERAQLAARMQLERAQILPQAPPGDATGSHAHADDITLEQATAHQGQAQAHLDELSRQAGESRLLLGQSQTRREAAQQEYEALRALLEDPHRLQRAQAGLAQMASVQVHQKALAHSIETRQHEVDAARADILQQDVQRLRRSAEQAQHQHHERQTAMTLLQGKLEEAGAQGLEEERAHQMLLAQTAARRQQELGLQAHALDLLLGLLESRRAALTRRLQAPLQQHIQRYLQLLFPQATLDIGDDLAPGRLSRTAPGGTTTSGSIAELSFGAREQMGVISRLAYADLLQQVGRPTLIILDDALVHSDVQRLAQMKRVLFDASQRHQVLLFTCHPELWRDLGALPRPITAVVASA